MITGFESLVFDGNTRQVPERNFFIDNRLVRIHFIIEMIRWTGLAPRELKIILPGALYLPSYDPKLFPFNSRV